MPEDQGLIDTLLADWSNKYAALTTEQQEDLLAAYKMGTTLENVFLPVKFLYQVADSLYGRDI